MTIESSYNDKVDIRAITTALLQLSPIVLVVIYTLEYSYAFQFLAQFGVTPEEVGISEIKLLTRAALLTLLFVSLFGMLAVVMGLLFAIRASVKESRPIRPILRRLYPMDEPKTRNRVSITESIRSASRQAQAARIRGTVSFGAVIAVAILVANGLGLSLGARWNLALSVIAIALTFALFAGWRRNNTKLLAWACGTLLGIVVLGLAGYSGGGHNGIGVARNGRIPTFANALGVDILQVHPEWLNQKVIPPQYSQNQDLLELGSDGTTAFLYDCRTETTYRIPLDDVVLTYPLYLNEGDAVTLQRLRCQ